MKEQKIVLEEGMIVEFYSFSDYFKERCFGVVGRWREDEPFGPDNVCIRELPGKSICHHLDRVIITRVLPKIKFKPIDVLVSKLK